MSDDLKISDIPSPYDQAEMMYETFHIINKLKADNGVPANKKVDIVFKCDSDIQAAIILDNIEVFKNMCNLNSLKFCFD